MAVAALIVVLFCAGCGRIAFDPRNDGGAGNGDTALTADSNLPSGLVAWYRLEEQNTTTGFADSSGNGHTAVCGPQCPSAGQLARDGASYAAFFGLNNPVLLVGTSSGDFDLAAFTVAAWAEPERTANPFEVLVSRAFGSSSANSFALDLASSGTVEFYSQPDNSSFGTTPYVADTWMHFAITYDGTTKRIYTNGRLESEVAAAAPVTYDSHSITIGADISASAFAYHFLGAIDEVMLFDRALTPAEMMELAVP